MIATSCKHCGSSFTPVRAGAQYCSPAHRTAAYRVRHAPAPAVFWFDPHAAVPGFSSRSIRQGADGEPELSNAALADKLVELSTTADDGEAKTGRRFYYLALSFALIRPSMDDTPEAKRSRDGAYKRVLDLLGRLRQSGRIGWEAVLDLTRELIECSTFDSPRDARAFLRRIYDEDRWIGQRYYPVVLVEKDTIEPVLRPFARECVIAWL
jgi:hypothetical protein